MDKAKKFLRKLPFVKQDQINEVVSKIVAGKIKNLDIKKLKGHKNSFRVRVGDIRIVFSQDKEVTQILFIGNRESSKYEPY